MSPELLPMVEEWPPVAILTPDELVTVDRLPAYLRQVVRDALSREVWARQGSVSAVMEMLTAYEALRRFHGLHYPDPVYTSAAAFGVFSDETIFEIVRALEAA